jgi:hypothetical protein
MENKVKILIIASAMVSMALIHPLVLNKPANAAVDNTFCDKGGSESYVDGCKQGWYDHDHCKKFNPNQGDKDYAKGYKDGWDKGSCK